MENNNNVDNNSFTKGLFIKMPPNNAPDFVLLNMSFKPHDFFTWTQQFVTEESRGWVNIQVKRSKDGSKIYGQLDTWKPKGQTEGQSEESKEYNETKYKSPERIEQDRQNQKEAEKAEYKANLKEEDLSDIPFS